MTAIKICGVTHPDDAIMAIHHGAERIGCLLWAGSKRHVDLTTAAAIAEQTKKRGAIPVAVVVDETLEQIQEIRDATGITHIQLHGPKVMALASTIAQPTIAVVSVALDGQLQDPVPSTGEVLFDTVGGGTGQCFSWEHFVAPAHLQWWLAGGLNPENVERAIVELAPHGVDVAGGVREHPRRLSEQKVKAFCKAVKGR